MPYKDPERQKEAQHQSYLRNKERVKQRVRERRAQPGYRKYAKRGKVTSRDSFEAERRENASRAGSLSQALRRRESDEAREASEIQRRLKAEAMRRMGFAA